MRQFLERGRKINHSFIRLHLGSRWAFRYRLSHINYTKNGTDVEEPSALYLRIMQWFGIYRGMSKTIGNLIEQGLLYVPGRRRKRRIQAASSHRFSFFHCTIAIMEKTSANATSKLSASFLTVRCNPWFSPAFTGASRCILITCPDVFTHAEVMQTPAFWRLPVCESGFELSG